MWLFKVTCHCPIAQNVMPVHCGDYALLSSVLPSKTKYASLVDIQEELRHSFVTF